ncbi:MAG: outer membrane lipoprotein carrier protein LolA [Bacteroidales bacterium]|jgi:outer membrane lipoprotein-sorting protein|nr:outer membrane lipoprotein carrier protein LolA [Bacteroidales bacterium]
MKKVIIPVMLLACGMLLHGQTISDADRRTVEKIRQANEKYTVIVSRFRQTRHLSVLANNVLSEGKFYYVKPDRLAMQYENPAGDLMMIDGDRFVMINDGKRRETSAKSNVKMRGMKDILSACLQGDPLRMGAERITCTETPEYCIVTAVIGKKSNKSNIRAVEMTFGKTDLTLSALRTEEKDGSYTVYELTGKEFDTVIDEGIFQSSKK